jgi:tetratricopeptide (TPR) repeat protein
MRSLFGALIGCALLWLIYILFAQAHAAYDSEVIDTGRAILVFGKIVVASLLLGIVVVTTFVPAFAEWVGNLFFNPSQEIEKSPHSAAVAAYARGEYAEAIEEYKSLWESNPADAVALGEVVRLSCEKLDDPHAAVDYLQSKLGDERTNEEEALLRFLLAEIHWTYLKDARRACELLQGAIEADRGGNHSAAAQHRLREIESSLAAES